MQEQQKHTLSPASPLRPADMQGSATEADLHDLEPFPLLQHTHTVPDCDPHGRASADVLQSSCASTPPPLTTVSRTSASRPGTSVRLALARTILQHATPSQDQSSKRAHTQNESPYLTHNRAHSQRLFPDACGAKLVIHAHSEMWETLHDELREVVLTKQAERQLQEELQSAADAAGSQC